MALTDKKITDNQINTYGVVSAPDTLTGTPQENKAVFDKLIKQAIAVSFNGLIDEFEATTAAAQIGADVNPNASGATVMAQLLSIAAAIASHAARVDNPHGTTKAQVGLGNADNTSDANKPISNATQTALNTLGTQTATAYTLAQSVSGTANDARSIATAAKNTADAAAEKVDGVYYMIDPTTGTLNSLQAIFNNIFNISKTSPITAAEFDALEMTAAEFDALQLTAFEFDTRAKQLLGG